MKKSILFVLAALVSMAVIAQDSIPSKGVHPYKVEENKNAVPELTHWSLIPHIGFSSFDGDFSGEMKHNVAIPSVGIGLEYNFTPVWNVGIEYMYDMYNVTGKQGEGTDNADTLLTGHMHKVGGYLSLDLINLFFPRAKKKIVSVMPLVGGGMAFYKRAIYYMDDAEKYPTHKRGHTGSYINRDGEQGPEHDDDYNMLGYLNFGANIDFNLNRSLALGLRANYSYFTRDYVDGRGYSGEASHASKNNDGIFDITLNLRYKINAVKKSHPRNMVRDYFMDMADCGNCGKKDTLYVYSKDTVVCKEIYEKDYATNDQAYYVYFDNAKSNLTEQGLTIIQQVAELLQNNDDLYVDVVGICDNTGADGFNAKLAEDRAKRVLEELKEEYNIPEDHFLTSGRGKIVGRRSKGAYGPNRRAEIRIISKEEFERRKNEREQKNTTYNINLDDNTPAVSDRESVNAMTLTRLARSYFGNPNCWVYIYEANRDKITDINNMPTGIDIKVPELTSEQKKITKEEAEAYYRLINSK